MLKGLRQGALSEQNEKESLRTRRFGGRYSRYFAGGFALWRRRNSIRRYSATPKREFESQIPPFPARAEMGADSRSTASASSRRPCLSRCGRRRELGVPVAGDAAGSLVGYEYVELDAITSTNKHPSSSRSRRKAFASRALSAIISFLLVKHALPPSCLPSLIRANPADPSRCLYRSRGTPCQN